MIKYLFPIIAFIFMVLQGPQTRYTDNDGAVTTGACTTRTAGAGACTISYAISQMASGDTLVLLDGTYNAQIVNTLPGGSAGSPTTVRAENRNAAILLPTSPTPSQAVININHSYITIDGIITDATNCNDNGGYYITDSGSTTTTNLIIKNGTIRNNTGSYSSGPAAPSGILSNHGQIGIPTNHQFLNNDISDTKAHGIYNPGSGNIIDGNRIHGWSFNTDINGYGVQVYCFSGCSLAPTNNIVRNNIIYDYQNGLIVSPNVSDGTGNTVYNNIIYSNNFDGIRVRNGSIGTTIYFNTVYDNGSYGTSVDSGANGTVIRNNIYLANGNGGIFDTAIGTACSNNLNVSGCTVTQGSMNPFIAAGTDFHLSADDNGGAALFSINTDFDNFARSDPPDRGAYEFHGAGVTAGPSIFAGRLIR